MEETYNRTGRYQADHSTFGGVILASDYNTNHYRSRNMARRIIAAWNFDDWCKNTQTLKAARI